MMWLADDTTPARVAPTRVYRWERDEETYHEDGGMLLRTDDDRPLNAAFVAQYWRGTDGHWDWMTAVAFPLHDEGAEVEADAARRACELAVLHGEREP